MISMVEKILRFEIKGCDAQLEAMTRILLESALEFLNGGFALDFEKSWMEKYIS
jgi:hypothetical protein